MNHDILISKLKYYGINNSTLDWFKSYLYKFSALNIGRQFVDINHTKSETTFTSIGVPQGSILGPLLFTIYVNDIQKSSSFYKFIKYADDTTLVNSSTNPDVDIHNVELNKVFNWLCANRLSLNINKTKFILFHNKNKNIQNLIPNIKVNNIQVERVSHFSFLGITINEQLNWNLHLDKICSKVSRIIGVIHKLKHSVPCHVLKLLYSSLIVPHFMYGILTWGMTNERLFKLQKKAVRVISNSSYNIKTIRSLSVGSFKILLFILYCHNQLPFYLQAFVLTYRYDVHNYDTRNKLCLNTNKVNIKSAENALRNVTPRLINNTPSIIIEKIFSHSLQGFVLYAKQYYINQYNFECSVQNCYTCRHT